MKLNLSEQFYSIQGEGKFIGVPSYFIRLNGCNLRCEWTNQDGSKTKCDTPYTSWEPEGKEVDLDDILKNIPEQCKHIVITGGEPFIDSNIEGLTESLIGYYQTIETNGTIYRQNYADFISLSPKLKSSIPKGKFERMHNENRLNYDSLKKFMENHNYQFKFVVNDKDDLNEILKIQERLDIPSDKIYLMAQGITTPQLKSRQFIIQDIAKKKGMNITDRLHIRLYGNRRAI
jgi:7-carboxy-7-deazaguanine synthase